MQAYCDLLDQQQTPKTPPREPHSNNNLLNQTNNSQDFRLRPIKSISLTKMPIAGTTSTNLNPERESVIKDEFKNESSDIVNNKNLLKTMTLEFNTKKSGNKKIITPMTVHNWLAARSTTTIVKNKHTVAKHELPKPAIYYSKPDNLGETKYQARDAQSLLRKNSLYLLSFITTKQRKSVSIPQVKNTPFVIDKIPPINAMRTDKKQRLEREKNFITNLKILRQQNLNSYKGQNYTSFDPEPW